jgi:hypothetical protein
MKAASLSVKVISQRKRQAMRNLGLALAAAGAGYDDIVKTTTYVVRYRPEHRDIVGKAKKPFFGKRGTAACALIGVSALAMPEWLIEIEAIAVNRPIRLSARSPLHSRRHMAHLANPAPELTQSTRLPCVCISGGSARQLHAPQAGRSYPHSVGNHLTASSLIPTAAN